MSIIVKPYTFSAGAVIVAAEHNSNFDTIYSDHNGGLTNANLSASAAIALSKISFTTALTMSGAITSWAKGADVASAAGNIALGTDGNFFDITGTAAITSITIKAAGTVAMLQFDSTATLTDGSNLALAGNFTGAAGSTITLVSDGTNWVEISRSPLSFTPSVTNALSKSVIQIVNTITGAVASGSTALPYDDTIPTITEGDEYMTLAITPNNSSNTLKIDVVVQGNSGTEAHAAAALFQDATSASLAVGEGYLGAGNMGSIVFSHYMTAGTTSATTFRIRAGSASGTFTFNGTGAARKYGGKAASSITITEYKA